MQVEEQGCRDHRKGSRQHAAGAGEAAGDRQQRTNAVSQRGRRLCTRQACRQVCSQRGRPTRDAVVQRHIECVALALACGPGREGRAEPGGMPRSDSANQGAAWHGHRPQGAAHASGQCPSSAPWLHGRTVAHVAYVAGAGEVAAAKLVEAACRGSQGETGCSSPARGWLYGTHARPVKLLGGLRAGSMPLRRAHRRAAEPPASEHAVGGEEGPLPLQ